jgi:hypothetical protein
METQLLGNNTIFVVFIKSRVKTQADSDVFWVRLNSGYGSPRTLRRKDWIKKTLIQVNNAGSWNKVKSQRLKNKGVSKGTG